MDNRIVAEQGTTGDRSAEVAERSAVGICCRRVVWLERLGVQDDEPNIVAVRGTNGTWMIDRYSDTALLLTAAECADEMLAALKDAVDEPVKAIFDVKAARAAIARTTGD